MSGSMADDLKAAIKEKGTANSFQILMVDYLAQNKSEVAGLFAIAMAIAEQTDALLAVESGEIEMFTGDQAAVLRHFELGSAE